MCRVRWETSPSLGAVVTEKINGLPLQSIIMKAALLPGYADHGCLGSGRAPNRTVATQLPSFHRNLARCPSIPTNC